MFGLNDNSDKNNQAAPAVDTHDPMGFANNAPQDAGMQPASSGGLDTPSAMPPQPVPPPPLMPGPVNGTDTASVADTNPFPSSSQPAANEPTSDSTAAQSVNPPSLASGHEDKLLKLKQDALQNLAPLMDHLDQTPEEKFKTTMMLIQASDNAELIPEAYAAANKLTDEKARAQALLDVVNEINYFTHQKQQASEN
jgi:hypothetical protein